MAWQPNLEFRLLSVPVGAGIRYAQPPQVTCLPRYIEVMQSPACNARRRVGPVRFVSRRPFGQAFVCSSV